MVVVAKRLAKRRFTLFRDEDFARTEIPEELVDIVRGALCSQEFAGGDIQKSDAELFLSKTHRRQEVVRFRLQYLVIERHTRCDQFRNAALDDCFGHFGILQLVADGDTESGFYQFGEIGVQGMMRKPGQCRLTFASVPPFCQDDTEDARGPDGIFSKGFVKIAHAKQEAGIGILGLDLVILLHQGRFFRGFFLC